MSAVPTSLMRPSLDSILSRAHLSVAWIAIAMAGLTLTIAGLFALRAYSEQNLHLVARSMSYTVEAALVFDDALAAEEALALIGSREDVAAAYVRDSKGRPFAAWSRSTDNATYKVEQVLTIWMMHKSLETPIVRNDREIGTIRVVPHNRRLLQFLLTGLACILVCLGISIAAALYLARRMQASITGPLHDLARVAHKVRRDRTFELRAASTEIAELNALNEDFNALMDELEVWQMHLQKENASLSYQASHDSLTDLPNRAFLETALNTEIAAAKLTGHRIAVLFLDCDHFKEINDSFGHAAGDQVLIAMSKRIKQQLREGDLVARLGGDEFAVLLKPLRSSADIRRVANKIIDSMSEPIALSSGDSILASVSIGAAVFPDHAHDAVSMLNAADKAMYRAKQKQHGSYQLVD